MSDAAPSTGAAGEQPRIRQFTRRGVMRTAVAAGITFALPASAATLLAPAEAAAPNRLVLPPATEEIRPFQLHARHLELASPFRVTRDLAVVTRR